MQLTTQELESNMTVFCPIWGGNITRTVQEWLTYREDLINEPNFVHLISTVYIDLIDKKLNATFGKKWWKGY